MMRTAALAVFLALVPLAAHAMGPAGKGNYIIFHGQAVTTPSLTNAAEFGTGLSVDWGVFQNKYVATGTRFGFSRLGGGSIEFGGGPQFHIPIGDNALIIPSLNLGYRLGTATAGIGINLGVAAAYRLDTFYVGAEYDAPMWLQGAPSFFPEPRTVNLLVGFYY